MNETVYCVFEQRLRKLGKNLGKCREEKGDFIIKVERQRKNLIKNLFYLKKRNRCQTVM